MTAAARIAARVAALVALWLLAWGSASPSKIVTGIVLAVAVLIAFPPTPRTGPRIHFRPIAMVKLHAYVLGQLVTSNVLVAREIMTPGSAVRTGVLAHPLDDASDEVISMIAHVIALTPGTMTVEATRDPNVLYVHFLLLSDVDAARRSITRLESLVQAAIGAPPTRTSTEHPAPGGPP